MLGVILSCTGIIRCAAPNSHSNSMTTTSTSDNLDASACNNADDLRAVLTRRRLALHSLDYTTLAHERDVGGCSSELPLPSSPHRYRDDKITLKVDDSLLNTPPMDISGLHQSANGANYASNQTRGTSHAGKCSSVLSFTCNHVLCPSSFLACIPPSRSFISQPMQHRRQARYTDPHR